MAALLAALPVSSALATSYTWTGNAGDNNWSNPLNWSPNGTPGASDSVSFATSASPSAGTASTLSNSASLTVSSLTIDGATVSNSGNIALASSGLFNIIQTGTTTLSGGGTITLGGANSELELTGTGTLVNAGNFIDGAGTLLISSGTLVNNATIAADKAGATLTIGGSAALVNNGTFEALNGGTLAMTDGVYELGNLIAGTLSTVYLNNNLSGGLGGGTISGAGTILVNQSNFANLTNYSTVSVMPAGKLYLLTGVVNDGNITASPGGTGSASIILENGSSLATLQGNGTITLNSGSDCLYLWDGPTDNASNYIHGTGSIDIASQTATNQGVIAADRSSASLLISGTSTGSLLGSFINSGTLAALNGASLSIACPFADTGTINAAAGSQVSVSVPATVGGGTFTGAGSISFTSIGTFSGFSNSTTLNVGGFSSGYGTSASGTINNSGTINVSGVNGALYFSDAAALATTLTGGGTVALKNESLSVGPGTFTNANNLIAGSGTVNVSGTLSVNQGTMTASGGVLSINGGTLASLTNSGTLQAINGATLSILCPLNDTGTILVGSNSGISIGSVSAAATINGGTIIVGANALATLESGTLSNATISGAGVLSVPLGGCVVSAIDNSGTIEFQGAAYDYLQGVFTNSGTIVFNGYCSNNAKSLTLQGHGTCNFADGVLSLPAGTVLNVDNTIGGYGSITVSSGATFSNEATIAGTSTTGVLSLSGSFINSGTLGAYGGGALGIYGSVANSGTIAPGAGSVVGVDTSYGVVTGGTIALVSGSELAMSGGEVSGANISGTGTVLANSGILLNCVNSAPISNTTGSLALSGTFNNSGTIYISGSGVNTPEVELLLGYLTGNGTIAMSGASEFYAVGSGTLVNANNTIVGSGELVAQGGTFLNEALINGTGNLRISTLYGGTFVNSGTILAASGTLGLGGPLVNNGVITAAAGSTVTIQSSLSGGSINGSGSFYGAGGTLSTVSNFASIYVPSGTFNLAGTVTNSGTITVTAPTPTYIPATLLQDLSSGTTTLAGGGTVMLGQKTILSQNGTGARFVNAGNTVLGIGTISASGGEIINQGTFGASVANGTLSISSTNSGTFANSGTILAASGGELSDTASITNSGTLESLGASTLLISANVSGGTAGIGNSGGTIAVGAGGTLSPSAIGGNIAVTGGTFSPQIGGIGTLDSLNASAGTVTLRLLASGANDEVAVTNAATLGANLNLAAAPTFSPSTQSIYTLLTAGGE